MSWATHYIEKLLSGQKVEFRPRGHSMRGKIESGQLCSVEPIADHSTLKIGDIVLCKVRGVQYLHLIKAVRDQKQFLIGNNRGGENGWISSNSIFGVLTKVSD